MIAGSIGNGIYKSTDNGTNWTKISKGFYENFTINSLTVIDSNIFAATYEDGVLVSKDNGANWTKTNTGIVSTYIYGFAMMGNSLYSASQNGVMLSKNSGVDWQPSSSNFPNQYITSIIAMGSNLFGGTKTQGVKRSTDSGATWTITNYYKERSSVEFLAANGTSLFACGADAGELLRSDNYGLTWKYVTPDRETIQIYSLAVIDGKVIAGTSFGPYFSEDNGKSWSVSKDWKGKSVKSLAVMGANIFAGTYSHGIYISTDKGKTWNEINNGLSELNISYLTANSTKVFAYTNKDNVFFITNNRLNWEKIDAQKPSVNNVFAHSLIATDDNLLVGAMGVWKYDLNVLGTSESTSFEPINAGMLISYPNPATNTLTINRTKLSNFTDNHPVTYTLTTLTGVKRMQFEQQATQFTIPVNGFPSGVYYVTAEQGTSRAAVMVTVVE